MAIPDVVREALQEIPHSGGAAVPKAMPAPFYTHQSMLEAEIANVFLPGWICLCRADEIPEPGDYKTFEFFEEPLIAVRQKDNSIRVLSNVCRHRGSVIMSGSGNTQRFNCPYHQWSYALDGRLAGAPLMKTLPHFNTANCSLPEFSHANWMGWLFVNLDGKAEALEKLVEGINPYVANYHAEEMKLVKSEEQSWPINWKCLAENFMEGYHLTPVHRTTLHPMTPTRLCEKIPGGAGYTGYKSHYSSTFSGRDQHHPDMSDEEKRLSMMVWIYPSFVAAISPNSCVFMRITPEGAEQLKTHWGVIAREAVFEEGEADERFAFAEAFNAEDRARLLDVQKGLHSRFYQRGYLAPEDYEGCVWDFYHFMADRLFPAQSKTAQPLDSTLSTQNT